MQINNNIKRDPFRRFILTSAILSSACAFNIRPGYIWVWLPDFKRRNEQEQVKELKI